MAFKDYENLDVTKETATQEELEKLKKKYRVEQQYDYKVGARRKLICMGISIILTVITILLCSNILVADIMAKIGFYMLYFMILWIIIVEIYTILLKRKNIKEDVWLLITMIDLLIFLTAFIIGLMGAISSTLRSILIITAGITLILLIFLMFGGKILGILR